MPRTPSGSLGNPLKASDTTAKNTPKAKPANSSKEPSKKKR